MSASAEMTAPPAMSASWAVLSPESLKDQAALSMDRHQLEKASQALSSCSENTISESATPQAGIPPDALPLPDASAGLAAADAAHGVSDGWCWVVQAPGQCPNSTPPKKARTATQGRSERMQQTLMTCEKRLGELEGGMAAAENGKRVVAELKELSRHFGEVAAEALEYVASRTMPGAMEIYERAKAALERTTTMLRQYEDVALVPHDEAVVAVGVDQSFVLATKAGVGSGGDTCAKATNPASSDPASEHSLVEAVVGLLAAVMCGCFAGLSTCLSKGATLNAGPSSTQATNLGVDKHVGGA